MRKLIPWEWELLDDNTARVKVIGGWVIRHQSVLGKNSVSESMVFISDRDHEWTIAPKLKTPELVKNDLAKSFEPAI